jgi:hypothetical protein
MSVLFTRVKLKKELILFHILYHLALHRSSRGLYFVNLFKFVTKRYQMERYIILLESS